MKWYILGTLVIALGGFNALLFHNAAADNAVAAVALASTDIAAPVLSFTENLPPPHEGIGLPKILQISGIDVESEIEQVTLLADGTMGIPKDPMNAGWLMIGPRPGERGSAVIDGHVNWWHGAKGVFGNLHKLKPGDSISVLDDKKRIVDFIVRKVRRYDAEADAKDVFSSQDGKAHLNIITCSGAWDLEAKQYAERLVVFADRVVQE